MKVEVRRQLLRVVLFFLPVGFRQQTQVLGLGGNILTCRAISPGQHRVFMHRRDIEGFT